LPKLVTILMASGVASMLMPPSYAEEAKKENRLICKREQQTGTRFARKICRTAAEWDAMETIAKRAAAEVVNRPTTDIEH